MWDEIKTSRGYALRKLEKFFAMPKQFARMIINLILTVYKNPKDGIFNSDVVLGLLFQKVAGTSRLKDIDLKMVEETLLDLVKNRAEVLETHAGGARDVLYYGYYLWRSIENVRSLTDDEFASVFESYPSNLLRNPKTPWEKLLVEENRRPERRLRALNYDINKIQKHLLTKGFLHDFSFVPFEERQQFAFNNYYKEEKPASLYDAPILQVRFASALMLIFILCCLQKHFFILGSPRAPRG